MKWRELLWRRGSTALLLPVLACLTQVASAQLVESFSDGDFTSNPTWTGDTGSWLVVTDSDVAAGATGSYTLRLSAPASSAPSPQYLSTQWTQGWGLTQTWGFWIGRRTQSATSTNNIRIWLYASESNLESNTVDGYAIDFGDNTSDDEFQLVRVADGSVAASIITSSQAVANGRTDFGILVRVTRDQNGNWTLHTSTMPASNGAGAIATDTPDETSTPVSQGSGTDDVITNLSNGYLGVVVFHTTTTAARAAFEFDQLYFEPEEDNSLPVKLHSFTAQALYGGAKLAWETASEFHNAGFEVERTLVVDDRFVRIASYINHSELVGLGTNSAGQHYAYIDNDPGLIPGQSYLYRLIDVSIDGIRTAHPAGTVAINTTTSGVHTPFLVVSDIQPNPAIGPVRVGFVLPENTNITVQVYSLSGECVRHIEDDVEHPAGSGEITIPTVGLAPGTYSVVIQCLNRIVTRRMVVLR